MHSRTFSRAPALLAAALAIGSSALATSVEARQNVLTLYSYTRLLPANVAFESGVRQSLSASGNPQVEAFEEFLDRPRFGGPAYFETIETYLREKYASRPPDVIIAGGIDSLRFLLERRDVLFPGVPVVHAGVERGDLDPTPALPGDVIGILVERDFSGTIAQALRWHPGARRLVIVTGQAPEDRRWEADLREAARAFEDRADAEFLSALATGELLQRLGDLGDDSVVVTPGYFQDGAGTSITPRQSLEAMAGAATAPVYSVLPTGLGLGIVGGSMISFEESGRVAGRAASELLAGASPSSVQLPAALPSLLHVDWRQVRRWGIDESAIPTDAVVLFRDPTLLDEYRVEVLLVAGALAFQALLILLLVLERRRRHAAELAERGSRLELVHASRVAVAGELLGSIAHEIRQPLSAILSNADAAALILEAGGDPRADLAAIVADIRRDDLRASEVIRRLRELLAKHEVERRLFDVNEVVREVETLLRPEARRRRVTIEIRTAGTAATMVGDRIQVQQVLLNLVLNAMDAVTDASEERRAIVIGVRTGAHVVDISVRDRGHGIAPEHLPRLFDSFFTTKREGMGLGLSIARTLVEAHGGRIRAENCPDGGSVFHVELPQEAPETTLAGKARGQPAGSPLGTG